MILATLEDIKKYVSINAAGDVNSLFRPYINLSNADYILPYAGDIAVMLRETAASETDSAAILNQARNLLEESLANFGVYRSLSAISVHITDYGVTVQDGTSDKPAEAWRMRDLKRDLLNNGYSALDRLLKFLNNNPTVFTDYNSAFAKANKAYIIQSATDFQEFENINTSAVTYNALKPVIKEIIERYISGIFCEDYITNLESVELEGVQLKAQQYIKKSIAAYTISHAAQFSCFKATAQGFLKKYDVLPYEQVTIPTSQDIRAYKTDRDHVGNAYLKKAIEIITNNPTSFTQCDGAVLIDNSARESSAASSIYNTKAALQL
jgi:hypothetical protein